MYCEKTISVANVSLKSSTVYRSLICVHLSCFDLVVGEHSQISFTRPSNRCMLKLTLGGTLIAQGSTKGSSGGEWSKRLQDLDDNEAPTIQALYLRSLIV